MYLFYQPLIVEGVHYLDADESRHCVKVLRKRKGDIIKITDGLGNLIDAVITNDSPSKCEVSIQEKTTVPPPSHSITIAISPTKNADRIEWFVEKAVEMGVQRIILMECEHTERSFIKTDRLVKVAISAMKQSFNLRLPTIESLSPFSDVIALPVQNKYIAIVDHTNPLQLKAIAKPNQQYVVMIGPEGDFSAAEVALALHQGWTKVSLGNSRLRTETAGLVACLTLNLINS